MPYEYVKYRKLRYRKWSEEDCSHEGVFHCPNCGKPGVRMRHITAQFGLIDHNLEVLFACPECDKRACAVLNRGAGKWSMDDLLEAIWSVDNVNG